MGQGMSIGFSINPLAFCMAGQSVVDCSEVENFLFDSAMPQIEALLGFLGSSVSPRETLLNLRAVSKRFTGSEYILRKIAEYSRFHIGSHESFKFWIEQNRYTYFDVVKFSRFGALENRWSPSLNPIISNQHEVILAHVKSVHLTFELPYDECVRILKFTKEIGQLIYEGNLDDSVIKHFAGNKNIRELELREVYTTTAANTQRILWLAGHIQSLNRLSLKGRILDETLQWILHIILPERLEKLELLPYHENTDPELNCLANLESSDYRRIFGSVTELHISKNVVRDMSVLREILAAAQNLESVNLQDFDHLFSLSFKNLQGGSAGAEGEEVFIQLLNQLKKLTFSSRKKGLNISNDDLEWFLRFLMKSDSLLEEVGFKFHSNFNIVIGRFAHAELYKMFNKVKVLDLGYEYLNAKSLKRLHEATPSLKILKASLPVESSSFDASYHISDEEFVEWFGNLKALVLHSRITDNSLSKLQSLLPQVEIIRGF